MWLQNLFFSFDMRQLSKTQLIHVSAFFVTLGCQCRFSKSILKNTLILKVDLNSSFSYCVISNQAIVTCNSPVVRYLTREGGGRKLTKKVTKSDMEKGGLDKKGDVAASNISVLVSTAIKLFLSRI